MELKDLHVASFKGAVFLIDSSSTTGGRKSVTHEYPQSDRRFVEDLGELRETYTMTGIIHGDNYVADRDNLIQQLKSEGSGELVHPFFGSLTVFSKPYSLTQNLNELGLARFSMTFELTQESVFPKIATNNTSLISDISGKTITSTGVDFLDKFNVSKNIPANFQDASTTLGRVADSLGINADTVLKVGDNVNIFERTLKTFRDNLNRYIFVKDKLLDSIFTTFNEYAQVGRSAKDQFDLLVSVFSFGDDDEPITPTTVKKVERAQNRDIINGYVQVSALSYAYNVVPSLTFDTEDDINEIQGILDEQFDKVIETSGLSSETISDLKDLRVQVRGFLDQAAVAAFKISTVETYSTPMTILAYQYYGDTTKTQQLIDLNAINDPSFVEGEVKVLV